MVSVKFVILALMEFMLADALSITPVSVVVSTEPTRSAPLFAPLTMVDAASSKYLNSVSTASYPTAEKAYIESGTLLLSTEFQLVNVLIVPLKVVKAVKAAWVWVPTVEFEIVVRSDLKFLKLPKASPNFVKMVVS